MFDEDKGHWGFECPVCHEWIQAPRFNGKCLDCHEATIPYPFGRDEGYCGDRWSDD